MRGEVMALAVGALSALGGTAFGGYTFTQSAAPAPTYSSTLTFDEPGAPTGAIATNAYASYGVPYLDAGDGAPYVSDVTTIPGYGWCGTGNSFTGVYGVFMALDSDVTEFSAQVWDPSGPPSFFGGGAIVALFDNGNQVGDTFVFTPAWGGVGDSWIDITTSGGSVFDEVRILGYGFFPETHMDNASWNAVPAPGACVALGLFGLGCARRRRA